MLKNLGPMRLFLIVISIVLTISAFFVDEMRDSGNKGLLYVFASMVPILMFVMLFDVMMNRIQIADKKDQPELQQRYRINGRIELLTILIMVVVWVPFFSSLLV